MNRRLCAMQRGWGGLFPAGILITIVMASILSSGASIASTGATAPVLRCGWFDNPSPANVWFDNPSPANVWLHDRDGDWAIGIQGGHQAKGDWPKFKPSDWVRTGSGSYGYGCACLRLQANTETREVTHILSAAARPLATCRKDPALKGMEPQNFLK